MKRSFQNFVKRLDDIGLHKKVEALTLKHHVSLLELYEGPSRATSISAARRAVYLWLMKRGKGVNEIARIFDRAPNGVWKMTRGKA
jgi:hypothetical protein